MGDAYEAMDAMAFPNWQQRAEKAEAHVRALATALQHHRADMHETSDRPCSTCAESASALRAVGVTPFVEGMGMDRQAPITPIRSGRAE